MMKALKLALVICVVLNVNCQVKETSPPREFRRLFSQIHFSPPYIFRGLVQYNNTWMASVLSEIKTQQNLLLNTMANLTEDRNSPRNCADLHHRGDTQSGVRTVYPYASGPDHPMAVFCDQTTDGGGWTVFQHRQPLPRREDFFRNWTEYRLGFGFLDGGEFWLGLDNIHALVNDVLMELRVDLEGINGDKRWAKYSYFYIGDSSDKYRLELGSYLGDAGDSFTAHGGHQFTTKDQDNDDSSTDCARFYKGGWWYHACYDSNLNGLPYEGNHTSISDGIIWKEFPGFKQSLMRSSLSVRPKFYNNL